jgi:hypothetical protein
MLLLLIGRAGFYQTPVRLPAEDETLAQFA